LCCGNVGLTRLIDDNHIIAVSVIAQAFIFEACRFVHGIRHVLQQRLAHLRIGIQDVDLHDYCANHERGDERSFRHHEEHRAKNHLMLNEPALLVAQATAALKEGRNQDACTLLAQVADAPQCEAELLQMAAVVHCLLGRHGEALPWLRRAYALAAHRRDILANLARACFHAGRLDEALACHQQLQQLGWPDLAEQLDHIAVLAAVGEAEEALARSATVARCELQSSAAWLAWGNALEALDYHHPALFALDRAIELDPGSVEAWTGKAVVFHRLQRYEDSLPAHLQAVQLGPDNAGAWSNFASTLKQMERHVDALGCCARALALLPVPTAEALEAAGVHAQAFTYPCVLTHQAYLLRQLGRTEEAAVAFGQLSSLLPWHVGFRSMLLYMRRSICDWHQDAQLLGEVCAKLTDRKSLCNPFVVMGTVDDPRLQKIAIENVSAQLPRPARAPLFLPATGERIRLAYVSADFHYHATAYLMNRFFSMHDRQRFEVFGVSLGRRAADDMTAQLRPQFDHFMEAGDKPDAELAQSLRQLGIDIAIDLKGYTHESRLGVFTERIAPLQISWLGFPATSGVGDIDVILADRHIIPDSHRQHYSEQVAWVDGCYQCNDDMRPIAPTAPTRAELNLPERAFVFCCHNAIWKVTPTVFACWMRILRAVPGSVLWLLEENESATRNLRREAQAGGVDAGRLVFAPRVSHDEHLARLSRADLFLDTSPCNAHTTASDALWAGLPLLTCTGQTFAGRVATSLLHAVGLPELICDSMQHYEQRAIALAGGQRPELQAISQRLCTAGKRSRLFDTKASCRDVERVYLALLEERGLLAGRLQSTVS
jgi:protein O-GlcNAc transferase